MIEFGGEVWFGGWGEIDAIVMWELKLVSLYVKF